MVENVLKKINKKINPRHYLFSPEWIVLGVNNVCNLHCKMCDVGTKTNDTNFAQNLIGTHPLNMPLELVYKIINDIAVFYPKAKLGYAFTEPLVYPHLIESLQYANSKKIFTSITTNALNLKQKAEELVNSGINEINISLDGPPEVHNYIRGNKKSFQKAIEGIDKIFELRKHTKISIYCVITEWNIGHLKSFLNFFRNYPIHEIGFMHTNFTPKNIAENHNTIWGAKYFATHSNIEEVSIDNFDLKLLWEELKSIEHENFNFKVSFSPKINSFEHLKLFYKEPSKSFGKQCNDIFSNIMIKSDGSVIPAHGRCYNLNLGNIYEKNLKEIWHNNSLREMRMDLKKAGGLFPACSRCCSAF